MAEFHDAGGATLLLKVVTRERQVLEEVADEVTLPGTLGYLGILPGHTPLITTLKIGELMYRLGKREHYLAISFGFAEISNNRVSVLAEMAEAAAEIDVAAAERSRHEAEQALSTATEHEFEIQKAKLEVATARLNVAGKHLA